LCVPSSYVHLPHERILFIFNVCFLVASPLLTSPTETLSFLGYCLLVPSPLLVHLPRPSIRQFPPFPPTPPDSCVLIYVPYFSLNVSRTDFLSKCHRPSRPKIIPVLPPPPLPEASPFPSGCHAFLCFLSSGLFLTFASPLAFHVFLSFPDKDPMRSFFP